MVHYQKAAPTILIKYSKVQNIYQNISVISNQLPLQKDTLVLYHKCYKL